MAHSALPASDSGILVQRGACLVRHAVLAVLVPLVLVGCGAQPRFLTPGQTQIVDRKFIEYPSGFELQVVADRLTAPSAIAFTPDGATIVAENNAPGEDPRIFGWQSDGTLFDVYPKGGPSPFDFLRRRFHMYGPIGGMVFHNGKLYVSHRDENDLGVITAFTLDGEVRTVVADMPAQGDYPLTDITVSPTGRLVFGMGAATNSGVVGLDNWAAGWVRRHPKVADQPATNLKLLGYRFDTPNPNAGLFGGDDVAVTAPFQPFNVSDQIRIPASKTGKPNAAIFSISPDGGDLEVEATGIRMPRGLAFNEYGRLYATNNGMELRGTRPVKNDPDVLLWIVRRTWYGWPDYSADLKLVSSDGYKPPVEMIRRSGYPELSSLIDHNESGLSVPARETLLQATFAPLSGAAKLDFVPDQGPFRRFAGSAIVALSGDRAPFATGGQRLVKPIGYKVVQVDVDNRLMNDFVYNSKGMPTSALEATEGLERPVDVKFAPDGSLYILDYGHLRMRNGREEVTRRTGKLYRLVPVQSEATTAPAESLSEGEFTP